MSEQEWDLLAETWRSTMPAVDIAPWRSIVAAARRRLVLGTIAEAIILLAVVALTWATLQHRPDAFETTWLMTLWLFSIVAVVFSLWSRRGMWHLAGSSAADFISVVRARIARQRTTLRFMIAMTIVEVVVVIVEIASFHLVRFDVIAAISVTCALLIAWFVVTHRRLARELQQLEEFESVA